MIIEVSYFVVLSLKGNKFELGEQTTCLEVQAIGETLKIDSKFLDDLHLKTNVVVPGHRNKLLIQKNKYLANTSANKRNSRLLRGSQTKVKS